MRWPQRVYGGARVFSFLVCKKLRLPVAKAHVQNWGKQRPPVAVWRCRKRFAKCLRAAGVAKPLGLTAGPQRAEAVAGDGWAPPSPPPKQGWPSPHLLRQTLCFRASW